LTASVPALSQFINKRLQFFSFFSLRVELFDQTRQHLLVMMCNDDGLFGIELSQQSDASEPGSDWLGPDSGSHIRYSASSAKRSNSHLPGAASAAKVAAEDPSAAALNPPVDEVGVLKRPAAAAASLRALKKRGDKGTDAPKDAPGPGGAADETPEKGVEVETKEMEVDGAVKVETKEALGILGEKSQELDERLTPHLPPGKPLTNTHMGRRVPAGLKARCSFRLFQVKMMWAKYTEDDKVQRSAEAISAVEAIIENLMNPVG
jgi:hypothetical protein